MSVMDLDLQRERRMDLLREAESRRAAQRLRTVNRHKTARGIWKLASTWMVSR